MGALAAAAPARAVDPPLDEVEMKLEKFSRGKAASLGALKDKKLKGQLAGRERLYGQSAKAAAQAEKWFLPIEGGYLEPEGFEKTYRFQQQTILQEVDLLSSRKSFDKILALLGPYNLEYTSNGHYMLVGGRKGHLAMMDMLNMDLMKEFQEHGKSLKLQFLDKQFLLIYKQLWAAPLPRYEHW